MCQTLHAGCTSSQLLPRLTLRLSQQREIKACVVMVQRCMRSVTDKLAVKSLSSFRLGLAEMEESKAEPITEEELEVLLQVLEVGQGRPRVSQAKHSAPCPRR